MVILDKKTRSELGMLKNITKRVGYYLMRRKKYKCILKKAKKASPNLGQSTEISLKTKSDFIYSSTSG